MFARIGHKLDSELRDRANEELAEASERAALAEREAGLANERTELLRQQMGWRGLTRDIRDLLVSRLSKNPADVRIVHTKGDLESMLFARMLLIAFNQAGWRWVAQAWEYSDRVLFGLHLEVHEGDGADHIVHAFTKAGFNLAITSPLPEPANVYGQLPAKVPITTLFIGIKRPWQMDEIEALDWAD